MTVDSYKLFAIKPKAATNLFTNPSFELGTTDWVLTGTNTIEQSSEQQRRGAYSCKCTYQDSVVLIYNTMTLTAVKHWYSIDIYIPSDWDGGKISIGFSQFTSITGTINADADMTITDNWQRVTVDGTPDAGDLLGNIRVYCASAPTAGRYIYVDGAQLETGTVATTYLDGDMTDETDETNFYWSGARHASTSVRTANTRAGGELVDITQYAKILNIYGLGMTPVNNISVPLTSGANRYQDYNFKSRLFTVSLSFTGKSIGEIAANRQAVVDLIKPDLTRQSQEIVLQYIGYDASGDQTTDPVNIRCTYVEGLESAPLNRYSDQADVTFELNTQYIQQDGNLGVELGFGETFIFTRLLKKDVDGLYQALGTGANSSVYVIKENPVNGLIYIGGVFSLAGGVANTVSIAAYDGTTFYPLGTGASGGAVQDILFDANGDVYACGFFTSMGGVANTAYIAKFDISAGTWSALGTGLNAYALCLAIDAIGDVYVGGAFTSAGGVANTNYIAKWDVSAGAFVSINNLGFRCRDIAIAGYDNAGKDPYVFAMTDVNAGTANVYQIGSSSWASKGVITGTSVSRMESDELDFLYICGDFSDVDSVTVDNAAIYDRNNDLWANIAEFDDTVTGFYIRSHNDFFVYGDFDEVTNTNVNYGFVRILNNEIFQQGIYSAAASPRFVIETKKGEMIISIDTNQVAGATVTAPTVTSAKSYPIVRATGPGTLWQIKNYTTNKAIYFDDLTLQSGEEITINLEPGNITFESTFRGNLQGYVVKGSNRDFELMPGDNNISAFMTGTDANSEITMTWKQNLHGLDAAQWS